MFSAHLRSTCTLYISQNQVHLDDPNNTPQTHFVMKPSIRIAKNQIKLTVLFHSVFPGIFNKAILLQYFNLDIVFLC